jgi:hypothetical protein
MKPRRLSPNAVATIKQTTDARKILRAYKSYAMPSYVRIELIKRAEELSIELPVKDVTYV